MNQDFMKTRPVLPLVLSMSYPMVLSMLVNALYNIVDSFFVARISENAMTALSLVFPLQNLVMAFGVGFGIGINAVVAYNLGAGNIKKANNAVTQGIILNAVHGIILTVLCIAAMPFFLRLFTDDAQVLNYGITYSNTVFLFSISLTVGVSFEKVFQAVGKMKISMLCMMIGCIINIILDPILIFGMGFIPAMGVRGAALATGIGQITTLLAYAVMFLARPLPIKFKIDKSTLSDNVFKKMYSVGIPATLNMALPSLLITSLNGILAEFSQIYVLILGIYYKLQTFIYLTANGVVQGIRPLVGFNYGAGRNDRVKSIFKTSLILGIAIMAVGTILCMSIPERLIELFSANPQTIAEGAKALRIISCGFVISSVSVMISGTYEGLGKGMPSLIISLIRYVAIIPISFLLSLLFKANGVWNAFWITEIIAAIASIIMFARFNKKTKRTTKQLQNSSETNTLFNSCRELEAE